MPSSSGREWRGSFVVLAAMVAMDGAGPTVWSFVWRDILEFKAFGESLLEEWRKLGRWPTVSPCSSSSSSATTTSADGMAAGLATVVVAD
jgi:hypothetical protein